MIKKWYREENKPKSKQKEEIIRAKKKKKNQWNWQQKKTIGENETKAVFVLLENQ